MSSILFVDQYKSRGGGQRVLAQLLEYSKRKFDRVGVLFPFGGDLEELLRRDSALELYDSRELRLTAGQKNAADVLRLLAFSGSFLRFRSLFSRFDWIYVNGGRLYLPCWILARLTGTPLICHVHIDHSRAEKKLLEMILRSQITSRVVVISDFIHSRLASFSDRFATDPRVVIVENALDRRYSEKDFASRFSPGSSWNVAIVGRVSEEKGQDVVLHLGPRFGDMKFFLIGDHDFAENDYSQRLEARAGSNVHFLGKVDDVPQALSERNIQVSIVPSRWEEPFGLVAIESMACSCLTLVRSRGELPNIARRTGALVFEDDESLAEMLRELASEDPGELERLARSQFSRCLEHYGGERYEERLEQRVFCSV